jgi:hypothetical protein
VRQRFHKIALATAATPASRTLCAGRPSRSR